MQSMSIFSCPSAVTITMRAWGSFARISRAASRPSFSFIVMSMVTRSGLSFSYCRTASLPFVASPQISKPFGINVSFTIILMKFASSTTRIRFPILVPPWMHRSSETASGVPDLQWRHARAGFPFYFFLQQGNNLHGREAPVAGALATA